MANKYEGVVERIQKLSEEQRHLYLLASQRQLSDGQRRRLGEIKVELQSMWLNRKRERTRFHDPLDDFVEQWYKKAA